MFDFLSRNRSRWMTLLSVLAALLVLAWWRAQGTPQPMVDAADDKLQCVSYAPFRKPGETPLDPGVMVSEARLREDLSVLAARSQCVRTYSVIQGLDKVPEVARSLGMKVLLGVWIGRERDKNDIEIQRAIQLAREYPDTIRGIVVGNEVLLRREQSAQQMAKYIDQVRSAVDVPVTYADVWEFRRPPMTAPGTSRSSRFTSCRTGKIIRWASTPPSTTSPARPSACVRCSMARTC